MRKLIFTLALCFITLGASAAVEKDTVAINQASITKLIEEPTKSKNGKEYIKYYAVVNGELVSTSKAVTERIQLCKKHGVNCALAAVRNKSTKKIIRIILN